VVCDDARGILLYIVRSAEGFPESVAAVGGGCPIKKQ
jgi:hypothetical protein